MKVMEGEGRTKTGGRGEVGGVWAATVDGKWERNEVKD